MIYRNIDEYLDDNDLTPKQLAAKLGISESYMCMLRLGQRRPSPNLAQKMEAETGVPFKKLLLSQAAANRRRRLPKNPKPLREQAS